MLYISYYDIVNWIEMIIKDIYVTCALAAGYAVLNKVPNELRQKIFCDRFSVIEPSTIIFCLIQKLSENIYYHNYVATLCYNALCIIIQEREVAKFE